MALTLVTHGDETNTTEEAEMIISTEMEHDNDQQEDIESELQAMNSSGGAYEATTNKDHGKARIARLRQRLHNNAVRRSGGRKKDDIWHFFTKQLGENGKAVAVCNTCGKGVFPKAYVCKIHISKCQVSKKKVAETPRAGVKAEPGTEFAGTSASACVDQRSPHHLTLDESLEVITAVTTPRFPPSLVFGIVGGGVIAKSIIFPLIDQGSLDPYNVLVSGTTPENLEAWTERGCTTVSNIEIFEEAVVLVWALKPETFPKVTEELTAHYADKCKHAVKVKHPLHISVMGGITLEQFTKRIGSVYGIHSSKIPRTVRTAPNICHRVGTGCTAFTLGPTVEGNDRKIVELLFSSTGVCTEVLESELNGFGALTGSGVGFMFPVLDALCDGAVNMGIPRDVALKLAAQTMKGAAEFFLKEGNHPGALKDGVCSPGGSTIAGIIELERAGVRRGFISAVDIASKTSAELGKLG